jgi:hypothetical protein
MDNSDSAVRIICASTGTRTSTSTGKGHTNIRNDNTNKDKPGRAMHHFGDIFRWHSGCPGASNREVGDLKPARRLTALS